MIDRAHDLPITRQAEALNISRGSVYYLPRPVSKADLAIMRRLDRLHLEFPFAGSRMLRRPAGGRGVRKRPPSCEDADAADGDRGAVSPSAHDQARAGAQTLIRICCAASRSHGQTRCGRWTSPTSRWRAVSSIWQLCSTGSAVACSSWRVSITMEAAFCVEALEDALACHGKPEIFNTDQGSQFTGAAFTGVLIKNGIAVSMDGKGAWRTTCSSSGCGAALNTRRCICGPTKASATPAL